MVDLRLNKHTLRKQYVFFTIIMSWIIVVGLTWACYSTYTAFQKDYTDHITLKSQELIHAFDEKISFIEHFLQFIGFQIKNSNVTTIEDISDMIKYHEYDHKDDAITWNMVDFIDTSGFLIADSKTGIRKGIKIEGRRNWVEVAKRNPWKLQFASPGIGLITGDYIIPSGLSIYDDNTKKFYGFLSSSISIEKLTTSLMKSADNQIVFTLLDDSINTILFSDPLIDGDLLNKQINKFRNLLKLEQKNSYIKDLKNHIKIGNIVFSHYCHSSKYPFWFLIGYNKDLYYDELWNEILPKIIINVLIWLTISSILGYLSYQVARPIIILGRAADNVSKGRSIDLPVFRIKELDMLARQLRMISKVHSNLKKKQSKLSKANSELSKANEFINTNMSFLSHELINPTASILEFSKMLQAKTQSNIDSESHEYLSIINIAASHLNKQLNFFIKLFKFQAERKSIENKNLPLKQLLEWNLSMIMHHIRNKQIVINLDIATHLTLLGDEIMIGQLFQNIASNAAKYNKLEGTLLIKGFINNKQEIEIHFIDSGIGINKQDLKNIFKLFKRADNLKKDQTVGYGIGLAYAQGCVKAHEGKIHVVSRLGKGTTFKIIFPMSRTVLI